MGTSKAQRLILLPHPQCFYPCPQRRGHGPQSPPMASSSTWFPCPSKATLTSSQVPGDEAEEETDEVTQVLLTAMLTLLQSRGAALATPRHGAARVLFLLASPNPRLSSLLLGGAPPPTSGLSLFQSFNASVGLRPSLGLSCCLLLSGKRPRLPAFQPSPRICCVSPSLSLRGT